MIYADYAATTPVDQRVVTAMMPYFTDIYGNASSTHRAGMSAQHAVMQARASIASDIGARLPEMVFTSGATEAINLAVLGCARQHVHQRRHIVTVATEHPAMLDSVRYLRDHGHPVTFVGVDNNGLVREDELEEAVTDDTLLVSVMAVNNETGVRQNLYALSAIAHRRGALFMTDATQAWGKIAIDVDAMGIDLMTFSGHKLYGPKGIGALYVRTRKELSCALEPLQFGGGQERGLRSGTLNVPGIVGLAEAGTIAHKAMNEEHDRIATLRDTFEAAMIDRCGVTVNGSGAPRSVTTSNITFGESVDVDILLMHLPHVAVSKGSACSSTKGTSSHVLAAMGRTAAEAARSLRVSFGRFSTEAEVEMLVHDMVAAHENARLGVLPA
jgi:cysteine desulfurase